MAKNKFRKGGQKIFRVGDFVTWEMMPKEKLEIIFKNMAQNGKEQNMYKLRVILKSGRVTQTNWIPEKQITK